MDSSLLKVREHFISTHNELLSTTLYHEIEYKASVANNSFSKRLLDIIFSVSLFIFVFSWLFPLIALLIKITSKGPVFFRQKRTGLDNQHITCYKFRSMKINSSDTDDTGKFNQAIENDPRTTSFGRFLRKTSLDELPQFWSVFLGDMSVVGPRPHPALLNLECEAKITNYSLRYLIKPGITGWAQVKGYRGGTQKEGLMQQRINHDLWYINNWNLLLDIKIMILTLHSIFIGDSNAY